MLEITINREQKDALDALAYRIADNNYMIERYGRAEVAVELAENHGHIVRLFDALDALGVPYWTQNAVMGWAENWRRYKEGDWLHDLNSSGYSITLASSSAAA